MSTAVQTTNDERFTYETDHGPVMLSPDTIRKYLVSGKADLVTSQEVMMYMSLCRYQKLNPFLKESYLIKFSSSTPASMVVAYTVHVKRACKNPVFDGIRSGVILRIGNELEYREGSFSLDDEEIVGGWAEGHRTDQSIPMKTTVAFREYVGKDSNGNTNRQWKNMPGTMIMKVAVSQCLRSMFPEDLEGMYTEEEMQGRQEIPEASRVTSQAAKLKAKVEALPPEVAIEDESAEEYVEPEPPTFDPFEANAHDAEIEAEIVAEQQASEEPV